MKTLLVDIISTGIDPSKDRIIHFAACDIESNQRFESHIDPQIIVPTLPISIKKLSQSPPFSKVFHQFLQFIQQESVILIAHNGHSFVFPLLTKELRRARISLHQEFFLWDTIYIIQQSLEDFTNQSIFHAGQRIDILEQIFQQHMNFSIRSSEALNLLRQVNEKAIAQNPQPIYETSCLTINKL